MDTNKNKEKAQNGLALLKDAILDYIRAAGQSGARNIEIVDALELYSDYEGKNRNYLVWSIIGLLLKEEKIFYEGTGQQKRYFIR
jgi:hypothetical protein